MKTGRDHFTKDLLQVSAYIDNALSPKENAEFEAHLAASPNLQQQVLEYKRLKAALRALPQKKSPRNFTLAPGKVKAARKTPRLAPAFSLATAGVAIMLMLTFAGEFILGGRVSLATESMPAPEMKMLEAVDNAEPAEPLIIFWGNEGAVGKGGGSEVVMGLGGGPMMGSEGPFTMPETEIERQVLPEEPPVAIQAQEGEPRETVIYGLQLEAEANDAAKNGVLSRVFQAMRGWPTIRWVQVGLGTLLLATGVTALVLWLGKRR